VPSGERVVQVRLDGVRWERARDFGEIFLTWRLLGFDRLVARLLPDGDEAVPWHVMAFMPVMSPTRVLFDSQCNHGYHSASTVTATAGRASCQ
jgi:hypothetical protein